MGKLYRSFTEWANDLMGKYTDAYNDSMSDFLKKTEEDWKFNYNKIVTDFYQDYEPKVYKKRRGSLYDLIRTGTEDKGDKFVFYADFDPSLITARNGYNKEDGLYKTVFKEGYHGGANMNGKMSYPYKLETGNDGKKTGSFIPYNGEDDSKPYTAEYAPWRWSRAKRSTSPYEAFLSYTNSYNKNVDDIFNDILIKKLKEYLSKGE